MQAQSRPQSTWLRVFALNNVKSNPFADDLRMDQIKKEADEMSKKRGAEKSFADERVSMEVIDGIEDVALAVRYLTEALECVSVAVSSGTVDSGDFIEGALYVLMQSADSTGEAVSVLLSKVKAD